MTEPRHSPGGLLVVGTPLGNLSDISERAVGALNAADLIACEDSRRSGQLLSHLGVGGAKLVVVNEHTEVGQTNRLIDSMAAGLRVVLISDAGMPTISDPGHRLVAAVVKAGLALSVVPGPTAAMATLAVSGMPADRFIFEGFLPRKGAERKRRLQSLTDESRTVVLYEAPHRIVKTLDDLISTRGGTNLVCIGREMTKLYEQILHATLGEVRNRFDETKARGEFVVVLAGVAAASIDDESLLASLRERQNQGLTRRDAVAEVTKSSGSGKRRVYNLALSLEF